MDVRELAADYAALVAAGKMDEAARKHWSDEIVTIEAMPGEMSRTVGREAALAKAQWWEANHEVHAFRSEGPFVNGDSFLILMDIDVTPKVGERMQMREVVGYRVAGGKVVEERYDY
ncbi:MAG: SnoaL-like domain-containing protein [Sphingomonadaceae bacterium]